MKPLWKNVTLWSLTLGHFSVDMLAGAMPIVVGLYLKETLLLDLAQIGLMLAVFKIASSLTQPVFGYYSDLYGGRWFAVGGVLWMSLLIAIIGFLPDFNTALIIAGLAGFGSAAFHPQGASGANAAAGPKKKTAGVAMFMLGGNMGYAVGPILAALIMENVGVRGTALLSLVSLLTVPMLYFLTGQAQRSAGAVERKASWKIELNPAFTMLAIVALILTMSLRAWSQESFSAFLPQYFVDLAQFSREQASLLSSVMLFVLAFGSVTGGMLSDRFGGVRHGDVDADLRTADGVDVPIGRHTGLLDCAVCGVCVGRSVAAHDRHGAVALPQERGRGNRDGAGLCLCDGCAWGLVHRLAG
ncbi:MAG: MFS transporter [Caldilineaceae bacterium]